MARSAVVVVVAMLAAAFSAQAEPPAPARASVLDNLVRQDCGSCHGMTFKGGLGPALLPERLADRTVDELAAVILYGRPGTPMPPWDFEITEDEAAWIARRLKEGW